MIFKQNTTIYSGTVSMTIQIQTHL